MRRFRDPTRRAWMARLMIGLVMLAGCATWKPRLESVDENTRFDYGARALVTLAGGTQVKVSHLHVARDTLWGYTRQEIPADPVHMRVLPPDRHGRMVGCPISAVRLIETRQASPGRTAGLVLVTATLAAVGLVIVAFVLDPISISMGQ